MPPASTHTGSMPTGPAAAARNNAEWCDVVCRSHGASTQFANDAWTSATRTPPLYPDAVTLVPDVSVPDLLARVDRAAGCSVKDSFASLDLAAHGFRVLFDSVWIVRTSAPIEPVDDGLRWELVRDPDDLAAWECAWRAHDAPNATGSAPTFRTELLDTESVSVLSARDGDRIVAGAILNPSIDVVGISNFFADARHAPTGWTGCVAFAASLFPTRALVGHEPRDRLAAVGRDGFEASGPLRVWIYEG